jgi:hypothetical protein
MAFTATVFLLSPASCAGVRAQMLLKSKTSLLRARLETEGAPLGEVFTFMSSLYFRGKLAYATAFAAPPPGWSGALVIAPGRGLVPVDQSIAVGDLRAMAAVPVDADVAEYREPLDRDAAALARGLGAEGRAVLLGSIATDKYVTPLAQALGERLHFPPVFVGRGDMSRGGLLLRCAASGTQLEYAPVLGAVRNGKRPAKLGKLPRHKTKG